MATLRSNCHCLKALNAAADVGAETWHMAVTRALDCYALSPVAECREVPLTMAKLVVAKGRGVSEGVTAAK